MKTTLVIALLLALVGCSSPDPVKPSAGTDEDNQRSFAKCMRDHGVDRPDPGPNVTMAAVPADDEVALEAERKAFEACRQHLPDGGAPEETNAADQDKGREETKCLKAKGFDSDNAEFDPEGPEFQQALRECAR